MTAGAATPSAVAAVRPATCRSWPPRATRSRCRARAWRRARRSTCASPRSASPATTAACASPGTFELPGRNLDGRSQAHRLHPRRHAAVHPRLEARAGRGRDSRAGPASAPPRPTACRCSGRSRAETASTSQPATACSASRWRPPRGAAVADMVTTANVPAWLAPMASAAGHVSVTAGVIARACPVTRVRHEDDLVDPSTVARRRSRPTPTRSRSAAPSGSSCPSGQVGMTAGGSIPEDPIEQLACALDNVERNLEAAGMGLGDLVKLTTYPRRRMGHGRPPPMVALGGWAMHRPCTTPSSWPALASARAARRARRLGEPRGSSSPARVIDP